MLSNQAASTSPIPAEAPVLGPDALAALSGGHADGVVRFGHGLQGHPLLSLPRLTVLAGTAPRRDVEVFGTTQLTSPAAQVQSVVGGGAPLRLRRIDFDAAYADLIARITRALTLILRGGGTPPSALTASVYLLPAGEAVPPLFVARNGIALTARGAVSVSVSAPGRRDGAAAELAYAEGTGLPIWSGGGEISEELVCHEGDGWSLPAGDVMTLAATDDAPAIVLIMTWCDTGTARLRAAADLNRWLRKRGFDPSPPRDGQRAKLASLLFR